jgi:PAS domain S-box-containing protein
MPSCFIKLERGPGPGDFAANRGIPVCFPAKPFTLARMGRPSRVIASVSCLTAALIIASTLLTYWFGNRVLRIHLREERRREVISQVERLASTMKDAETSQRGFIITGNEGYLQPYNEAVERLPGEVEKLNGLEEVEIKGADVQRIGELIQEKFGELRATIELRRTSGFDAAAAVIQRNVGKDIMDQLRNHIEGLEAQQFAALQVDSRSSKDATRTRTLVFVLTGIVNIVFLAWAYFRIVRSIQERDSALAHAYRRGKELEQQKDLLAVTLASIGDCVMVTDKDGQVTFMNHVAEEVTGWTLAEASGRPTGEIFRILNEHSRETVESPVEKVMKHGVIVGLANHTVLVRKDGSEVPIDDSGAPIRDRDGTFRGVVLVFRDFSAHKRTEHELRVAKETAETANKAKDQFLAMLSHELRTPLTPVLATLNLWEASEEVPVALHADVQMLRRSIELEARIIDDLLDLTRIARGMLSFSPENTDVHALIEFLVGLSQSELQNKQLKVELRLNALRHNIHTDASRLQQVLWNILRNAVKFTDMGGSVTIATSNDARGNVDIAVADTGIGMTEETISKLFIPFEQADPTRNRHYGGLGLGMAISNALIDLLEGELTATSEGLGRGSTFVVSFPATESVARPIEPDTAPAASTDRIRLLIVEDHVDTARALVRLLENRGYQPVSVHNVKAGLEAVGRNEFDLILCDLGLPDGTGIDFIRKVRERHQTPAIALTGFGMQQDVERAEQAGFNAHLTKPVNLQKLEATILKLLAGERQAAGSA